MIRKTCGDDNDELRLYINLAQYTCRCVQYTRILLYTHKCGLVNMNVIISPWLNNSSKSFAITWAFRDKKFIIQFPVEYCITNVFEGAETLPPFLSSSIYNVYAFSPP